MSRGWSGGSDSRWRRFRLTILIRDRYRCTIRAPGCTDTATEVDHIIPLHAGGEKYDPANCRAACGHCNRTRSRTRPEDEPPPRSISKW